MSKQAITPTQVLLACAGLGLLGLGVWAFWPNAEPAAAPALAQASANGTAQQASLAAQHDLFAALNGNPLAASAVRPGPGQEGNSTTSGLPLAQMGAAGSHEHMPAASGADGGGATPQVSDTQLSKLGYHIAERYYHMPLAQLRESAKNGDTQALTHLAERYLFALDGKPKAPDYEPDFPYREAAREALNEALARGNLHAAAMLSESYLLEKRPVDAAAWNLLARRVGDELSADWFVRTEDYKRLSDAQRQQAAQLAEQLWNRLEQRKKG